MEDIIYVLDNRVNIVREIEKDDTRIAQFIKEQLQSLITKGLMQEVLMAHIHPLIIKERLPIVEDKIIQILNKNYVI